MSKYYLQFKHILYLLLVFVVPECEEKPQLKALIETNGGKLTDLHECFTYQIEPLKVRLL